MEPAALFDAADAMRRRHMGDGILFRGIVEFGTCCRNTCFYCGLHAGNSFIPHPHTRLGSMDRDYRVDGLKVGANVLMPNFITVAYKKLNVI